MAKFKVGQQVTVGILAGTVTEVNYHGDDFAVSYDVDFHNPGIREAFYVPEAAIMGPTAPEPLNWNGAEMDLYCARAGIKYLTERDTDWPNRPNIEVWLVSDHASNKQIFSSAGARKFAAKLIEMADYQDSEGK